MLPSNVKLILAVIWTPLFVSLMGCAHNLPTPPDELPMLPPPPSLSTPLPSVDYSLTASETIKTWREKLRATRMMSEPIAVPGR